MSLRNFDQASSDANVIGARMSGILAPTKPAKFGNDTVDKALAPFFNARACLLMLRDFQGNFSLG